MKRLLLVLSVLFSGCGSSDPFVTTLVDPVAEEMCTVPLGIGFLSYRLGQDMCPKYGIWSWRELYIYNLTLKDKKAFCGEYEIDYGSEATLHDCQIHRVERLNSSEYGIAGSSTIDITCGPEGQAAGFPKECRAVYLVEYNPAP